MFHRLLGLAVAAATALPVAAGADVYKWTDERGGASYGERPPAGARNVTRLTLEAGNVSIIPVPKPSRPAAVPQPGAEAALQGRSDGPLIAGALIGTDDPEWRRRCVLERRVDCDSPTAATFDVTPSFGRIAPYR